MVEIEIDTKLSVAQNANKYYEIAKKSKKKMLGAKMIIEKTQKELDELLKKREEELEKITLQRALASKNKEVKKEWYEKFRWFYTSKNHLVIGGRDATTNEIIIKKHTEENDLVFHTDMSGSPFFILKLNNDNATEQEINEVGTATATFSRAFKLGLASNQVLYVKPEQVTKEANSGEYVAKGSFVIRGKTNYVSSPKMEIAIGVVDGKLTTAPFDSLYGKCDKIEVVVQGDKKPSDIAKILAAKLDYHDIDDIVSKLPSGSMALIDERKLKELFLNKKYKK